MNKIHNPAEAASGGCICGGVRYSISARDRLRQVVACHCEQCRRFSGHYVAATGARYRYFTLLADSTLQWYAYVPGVRQGFCNRCGCSLFFDYPQEQRISILAGTLDDSHGLQEVMHIYTREAGCYYTLPAAVDRVEDGTFTLPCPT
ncbi:MAG TPA: GFA family protein [Thiolinea sp.]|nr:GFA family protein [Thiolinea sp.]